MSSSISLHPTFASVLIENDFSFKAALETLKIQKNNILLQEPKFLDPSTHDLKDLFNTATKDLFFFEIKEQWQKTCSGHEYKIASNVHKEKKAQEQASKAESDYKNNPKIIADTVWSEVRGHNDPFVHFRYIDNCNECNCKAIHMRDVKKINISDVLLKAEETAISENIPLENFYASILNYMLQDTVVSSVGNEIVEEKV